MRLCLTSGFLNRSGSHNIVAYNNLLKPINCYLACLQTIIKYRDKEYPAEILTSNDREPHFYWLLFKDPELLKLTDGEDSVCFQEIKGELVCTNLMLRINTPALIDTARSIIQEYLDGTTK